MNQSKELLRKQLALLAEQSKSAAEDDLPGLSSAMVDVYDRLKPVGFGGSLFRGVVIFFALADLSIFPWKPGKRKWKWTKRISSASVRA